jgi:hypothetical protein
MSSRKIYLVCLAFSMTVMVVVDYFMGESAGFFNAWALLMHTARLVYDLQLSEATEVFILHQEMLGRAALMIAWALFLIFHATSALLLRFIAVRAFMKRRKLT